jgi:hypothetical protein
LVTRPKVVALTLATRLLSEGLVRVIKRLADYVSRAAGLHP